MRQIWSKITAKSCIREARNGNIEFFLALTEFATDANPADEWGGTPLHVAASEGRVEVVRLILDSVEDKNPADYAGQTPLQRAARRGHSEVVDLIQSHL